MSSPCKLDSNCSPHAPSCRVVSGSPLQLFTEDSISEVVRDELQVVRLQCEGFSHLFVVNVAVENGNRLSDLWRRQEMISSPKKSPGQSLQVLRLQTLIYHIEDWSKGSGTLTS